MGLEGTFHFYILAFFMRNYVLEDTIVVNYLLPSIQPSDCPYILRELLRETQNDPHRESKLLLLEYVTFTIAHSLPLSLKRNR